MVPNVVLYRCGNFDWVPLPRIWGAVGYAPLLVLRQYKARQCIPATQGLAQCEFSYKGDNYKKKIREISEAWKRTCYVKVLTEDPTTSLEYKGWFSKRINDNIPRPSLEGVRSMEECLRVVPSEIEIMKQEFKRKSLELGKKIEKLEKEKNVPKFGRGRSKTIGRKRSSILKQEKGIARRSSIILSIKFKNRDYLMGEAIVEIREVADHLQALAAQADMLSVKYKLESDRGRELASLFDRVKTLGLRAKAYL
ncbi:hypothetical protein J1N35_019593 [Gossypium stocksii]|uniref:DUF7745 domain-containing protein n=1 Tax=Gossypium stocksii TaxID=47602 RepID=A0A9D4A8D1_9ROSI|nr:hypothetical protein J1N35_019593 [Gossypium stocksii]